MEFVKAKTILSKVNYGNDWYGIDYNMNLLEVVLINVFIVIVEVIVTI